MASVYGGTSLNLAACHAEDGNAGCVSSRVPEDIIACRLSTGDGRHTRQFICVPSDLYTRAVVDSPLHRRAWAFQERFLAPRTLYFTKTQLFWECQELDACETLPDLVPPVLLKDRTVLSHNDLSTVRHKRNRNAEKEPGLWSDIILSYSSGLLTHSEDKLVAISGVAQQIYETRQDQYLAGLWRHKLEWQLLWSVDSKSDSSHSDSAASSDASVYRAPSWSWASVDGTVRQLFPRLDAGGIFPRYLLIKIEGAFTMPLYGDDPFGQVRDGALHISCPGLLAFPPDVYTNPSYPYDTVKLFLRDGPTADKEHSFSLSTEGEEHALRVLWDTQPCPHDLLYLLPVWSMSRGKLHTSKSPDLCWGGLVVQPWLGKRGVYKRVGKIDSIGIPSGMTYFPAYFDVKWLNKMTVYEKDILFLESRADTEYVITLV